MATFTVLVADDHPIFRRGIIDLLTAIEEVKLEVVADASDGTGAFEKLLSLQPDLAILDHEMPGMTGLDILAALKDKDLPTMVIILTMHRDKSYYNEAMQNGVWGYLLKENAESELKQCILQVLGGKRYSPQDISERLEEKEDRREIRKRIESLTATEKQILKLIAEERTSKQIAELLFISPNTVENHRANMVKKLDLEGKNVLLIFALQHRELLIP